MSCVFNILTELCGELQELGDLCTVTRAINNFVTFKNEHTYHTDWIYNILTFQHTATPVTPVLLISTLNHYSYTHTCIYIYIFTAQCFLTLTYRLLRFIIKRKIIITKITLDTVLPSMGKSLN